MAKIEFNCVNCANRLSVEAEHAGKKARCPKCGTIQDVPGQPRVGPLSDHPGEMPTHVLGQSWEMKSPDGQTYGPVTKTELDGWVKEGRVPPSSYLRQQGGEWALAYQIYPQLANASFSPTQSSSPVQRNPFAENPYSAPQATARAFSQLQPHNGGFVLTMGILGIACCGLFGIVAIVMGNRDLRAMKMGQMDASGHGLTMAGYVLGIIASILLCGGFLLGIIAAIADM
ncbi:MAG TPA: hypothetical protein PKD64_11075 [Pirellulaceae bacterium]|nr:hypothetical protein [Pirellulaceae bacterium]HMO92725.1 hypothetical protein [Pirellulaceae bacterium]HMP70277.1 hypothetical protein [Pirellulaceae bacterium]